VVNDSGLEGKGEQPVRIPIPKTNDSNKENRPCSPAQSLANSLKEMSQISKGKLKKRTWQELRSQLK
jgi:hypothetical protein